MMNRIPRRARLRGPRGLAALAFAFAMTVLAPALARAAGPETRLAIVVGNNGSTTLGRAELRYADDDAAKYAALFASSSQEGDVYMLVARKPGGTKFTTPEEIERSMAARLAHVGTFVSTSADAQVYEWSRIESGVFSHSVRSGLSGAADLDGDGRISPRRGCRCPRPGRHSRFHRGSTSGASASGEPSERRRRA
jgi:hypothetical protein